MLIGTILAVPIAALTAQRLGEVDNGIQTATRERAGLARVVLLRDLLRDTAVYRQAMTLPSTSSAVRRRVKAKVDSDIAKIDVVERESPLVGDDWQRVQAGWHAYRVVSAGGAAGQQMLFDPLVQAIMRTADRAHLTSDPDPVGGLLADALTYRLPDGIERLQRIALSMNAARTREDRLDLRLTMTAESSVAASVLRFAFDDFDQADALDATVVQALDPHVHIANSATAALVDALGREARLGAEQFPRRMRNQQLRSTLASLYGLFDVSVPLLDRRLQGTINDDRRRRLFVLIPGLLAILGEFAIVILVARAMRARNELARMREEAERLEVELARNRAEARFAAIFQEAVIGIVVMGADGTLRETNPAFDAMLGYARGSLKNRRLADLLVEEDVEQARRLLRELIAGELEGFSLEQRYLRSDGSATCAQVSLSVLRDQDAVAPMVIALIHDVTERKRVDEQLIYAATHDSLTGLPNRAFFFTRLEDNLAKEPRPKAGVLFIDLDHFKLVNDSLGHVVGDELLQAVATRLVTAVSPSDMVARMGGDEFAVLFNSTGDRELLMHRADAMLRDLAEPFAIDGRRIYTTASIGIVMAEGRHQTAAELLRDADTAMYEAKSGGRARAAFFDARMHASTSRRMELASDLRGALERREFRLAYQPIVSLDSGEVVGYEALLRWLHPTRGILKPDRFLALAVETGLIVPIGRWGIAEGVRSIAALHEAGRPVRVHVNLSVQEMMQPDLDAYIADVLQASSAPPDALVIEITENAIVESGPAAERALERLLRLGVGLCVDDFGVGYSSLRYLHQFPIGSLKVDGSFVRGVDGGLANEPIVRMLVELARSLRLELIAEGVQTPTQRDALLRLGCRFGQGYLFGKPLWMPTGRIASESLVQEPA